MKGEPIKTTTHYVFWSFSDYSDSGKRYSIFAQKAKDDHEYKFLCEVELPEVETKEVLKAGVVILDNEIADLRLNILQKEEKKQQLLAIEFKQE